MLLESVIQRRTEQLFGESSLDLSQPDTYLETLRRKYTKREGRSDVNTVVGGSLVKVDGGQNVNEAGSSTQLALYNEPQGVSQPAQTTHPSWKLSKVLIGHKGWVRCITFDPSNRFFLTGSADTTIKAWDLATGQLKLTLTSHIMAVRSLAISDRHPYLFSTGEDKAVKLWDLEKNTVIRDYHGHLSGVYSVAVHPTLDLVITGSRDSSVKVWDIRTSIPVMTLQGHKQPVTNVATQPTDPQIISTSLDKTVRLWDLRAGKTQTVLTHHRKAIRALTLHPKEWSMATASADSVRQWRFPDGGYLSSFEHDAEDNIVNTLSVNQDGVLFAGGDDGEMRFYDWVSGKRFQDTKNVLVPGSLDSEGGVLASSFDLTGERLVVGGRDKSVKIWKPED